MRRVPVAYYSHSLDLAFWRPQPPHKAIIPTGPSGSSCPPHPAAAATCLPGWSRSLDSGKLRALGVTGAKRSEALPDVPTIAENALPGYQALQWFGILAPAGAPAPVVQLLQTRIAEGMRSAETKARLAADGAEAVASTPAEFAALINEEIEKWTVSGKGCKYSAAGVDQLRKTPSD